MGKDTLLCLSKAALPSLLCTYITALRHDAAPFSSLSSTSSIYLLILDHYIKHKNVLVLSILIKTSLDCLFPLASDVFLCSPFQPNNWKILCIVSIFQSPWQPTTVLLIFLPFTINHYFPGYQSLCRQIYWMVFFLTYWQHLIQLTKFSLKFFLDYLLLLLLFLTLYS